MRDRTHACARQIETVQFSGTGNCWWARLDSNLSRLAGVSAAGARWRNPKRSEGPLHLVGPPGFEPGTNRLFINL